jgi:glycosyltransferase involved in cell wall biosynthesis
MGGRGVAVREQERAPGERWRVLLTMPDLGIGGGQISALQALAHIDRDRYDISLLSLGPERAVLADDFRSLGVDVVLRDHRPGRSFLEAPAVARLLRRRGIDVVQINGPEERRLMVYASLLARVPAIQHLHSEFVHVGWVPSGGGPARTAARRAVGRARDLLERCATHHYLAASAIGVAHFTPHVQRPVHAMDQAMPLSAFDRAAAAHDDAAWRAALGIGAGPVVVNVSRLVAGKGHERLLAAFAAVVGAGTPARLVLVGDGECRAGLEAQAKQLGVAERVRFLGARRDVPWLLAGADLCAFCSETEAFGLVVAEAMAARLPVLAYRLPAYDAFCTDGITGIFPAQDDDAGFVAGMERLLGDADLRARLGESGRRAVAARFPEDAAGRSFEAAWARVLGPRRRPGRAPGSRAPTPVPARRPG